LRPDIKRTFFVLEGLLLDFTVFAPHAVLPIITSSSPTLAGFQSAPMQDAKILSQSEPSSSALPFEASK